MNKMSCKRFDLMDSNHQYFCYQVLSVESIQIHEDVEFGPDDDLDEYLAQSGFESDIALLKLAQPAVFNDRVHV